MTLKSLGGAWNKFFFEPESTVPISLFRIVYGALVVAALLLLRPDWMAWFGPHAWVSLPVMQQLEPWKRINLFTLIPNSEGWINGFFWVFLASALMLTAGFLTRVNSVVVFVCLASMHQRNLFITHGGDTFLRVAGFFLMFAPAGAALSVDSILRPGKARQSPWAQRMIQFELALMYFSGFWWKMQGAPWINGTSLYYVYHLDELRRFPMPAWFFNPVILKLGTWSALLLEFSLGILIWVKKLRYFLLACGLLFHLTIEYSLNIPLFEWDVLAGYILFIDGADLARAGQWVRHKTVL